MAAPRKSAVYPTPFRRSCSDVDAVGIRTATSADTATIGRLGALLVRTHHDFDPQRFIAAASWTEQAYGSFLESQLDKPEIVILVADRGGEGVGCTCAGVGGHGYIVLRGTAG